MVFKKHPIHTFEMLKSTSAIPRLVGLVAYQVHERPNGTGYPRCSTENSIHPFARILHVADLYIAMTMGRPFRAPLMPYAAMECLLHRAKLRWVDPVAVRGLLNVMSLFPIGSYVALSDDRVARVLRQNGHLYTSPIVQIVLDENGAVPANEAPIVALAPLDVEVVQALPTPGSKETALTQEVLEADY